MNESNVNKLGVSDLLTIIADRFAVGSDADDEKEQNIWRAADQRIKELDTAARMLRLDERGVR